MQAMRYSYPKTLSTVTPGVEAKARQKGELYFSGPRWSPPSRGGEGGVARRPGRTMGRLPGSSTSYRCQGKPTSTYLHSPQTSPRDHATRAHSSGKLPRVKRVDVPDGGPRPHTAATRPLNHNKLNPREGPPNPHFASTHLSSNEVWRAIGPPLPCR